MSKERLEEIDNKVIKDTVVITNKKTNKINYGHSFTLLDEDYRYLIEEASRVPGLTKVKEVLADKLHAERKKNKRYREAIEELIDSWKDNVKTTKQHNESDYSSYRTGLIEGLEFAIDELENVLEDEE